MIRKSTALVLASVNKMRSFSFLIQKSPFPLLSSTWYFISLTLFSASYLHSTLRRLSLSLSLSLSLAYDSHPLHTTPPPTPHTNPVIPSSSTNPPFLAPLLSTLSSLPFYFSAFAVNDTFPFLPPSLPHSLIRALTTTIPIPYQIVSYQIVSHPTMPATHSRIRIWI
jgi:hypothetical protein